MVLHSDVVRFNVPSDYVKEVVPNFPLHHMYINIVLHFTKRQSSSG